jgi:hypothetical protein
MNLSLQEPEKGKILIIMPKQDYKQKVENFINTNSFENIAYNCTEQYKKAIGCSPNNNKNVIQRTQNWKLINLNPQPPNLTALVKLHKPNNPIRPIINWHNAPAYYLAQHLVKFLCPSYHVVACNHNKFYQPLLSLTSIYL